MEAFVQLIKTDNITIILMIIAIIWLVVKNNRLEQKLDKFQDKLDLSQGEIVALSAKVGRLEGKETVEDRLISTLDHINTKMDIMVHRT